MTTEKDPTLAEIISKYRAEHKLSTKELTKKAGVRRSNIILLCEQGHIPSKNMVYRIVHSLLGLTEEKAEELTGRIMLSKPPKKSGDLNGQFLISTEEMKWLARLTQRNFGGQITLKFMTELLENHREEPRKKPP